MPTHQDETLHQRYAREHLDYLKLCGSMTAEQVADLQLQLNNSLAREQALQQRLTAADERTDVLATENKRLDLMVSQADYSYDADRMQFKARIDELEALLRDINDAPGGSRFKKHIEAALKPAEPAKDEHVCTGCGSKGWTANCAECVPY